MQLSPELARYVAANIDGSRLLKIADAARMFEVGVTTFDQIRKRFDLGEVRIGRSVRFKLSAIQRCIDQL